MLLCLAGATEYQRLARSISPHPLPAGYFAVPLFGAIALAGFREPALLAVVALAVGLPFFAIIFRHDLAGAFIDWSVSAAGALYLGIPVYAAVQLRQIEGTVSRKWLTDLADFASFGWDAHPRGLAWLVTVILVTWLSDTGAYLTGRSFGKRPLIPVVSPKKTVEGLIGGLVCAGITGAISDIVFGLAIGWGWGLLIGIVLAIVGVAGDLAESVLKRQAGVKDSGTLIPGHGGMLDRLDALLFTWTVGWLAATLIDRAL